MARHSKNRRRKSTAPKAFRPWCEALEGRVVPAPVSYHNGPVLANVDVVPVFLGSAWGGSKLALIQNNVTIMLNNVVTSPFMDTLAEYSTGPDAGAGRIHIGEGTTKGALSVTAYPIPSYPDSVSDSDIRAELNYLVQNNKIPGLSANTLIMTFVPPGTRVRVGNVLDNYSDWGFPFAGYHQSFTYNGQQVSYAVIADTQTSGTSQAQTNRLTQYASHELAEAVTNPNLDIAIESGFNLGGGWFDFSVLNEIGDKAANAPTATLTAKDGGKYVVSAIWSNRAYNSAKAAGLGDDGAAANAQVNNFPSPLTAVKTPLNAVAGQSFSGTLARLKVLDPYDDFGKYSVTITWGDGSSSSGFVVRDPKLPGTYDVSARHTYPNTGDKTKDTGDRTVHITLKRTGTTMTADTKVTVAAPPIPPDRLTRQYHNADFAHAATLTPDPITGKLPVDSLTLDPGQLVDYYQVTPLSDNDLTLDVSTDSKLKVNLVVTLYDASKGKTVFPPKSPAPFPGDLQFDVPVTAGKLIYIKVEAQDSSGLVDEQLDKYKLQLLSPPKKDSKTTIQDSLGTQTGSSRSVLVTATVVGHGAFAPTGTVTFFDGSNQLGPPVPLLTIGSQPRQRDTAAYSFTVGSKPDLRAEYSGDGHYKPSSIDPVIDVTQGSTDFSRFQVTVNGNPAQLTAGQPVDVTVTAENDFGDPIPTYSGTIALTSNDPKATLPAPVALANQSSYTFKGVVLHTAGQYGITASDGTASGVTYEQVVPGPLHGLQVDIPPVVVVNKPFTVTLRAVDADGNAISAYNNSATLTSSDPLAILPTDPVPLVNGTGLAQVTFGTQFGETLTAGDGTFTDTSLPVQVQDANPRGYDVVPAANPATAGQPLTFQVIAFDALGETATPYNGSVTVTVGGLTYPVTITDGAGTVTVTPAAATPQLTVQVIDDADATLTGQTAIVVQPANTNPSGGTIVWDPHDNGLKPDDPNYKNGNGHSWEDAFNWKQERVPGPGDVVSIGPTTDPVTINSSAVIRSIFATTEIDVNGGALSVGQDSHVKQLTITGSVGVVGATLYVDSLDWVGGTLSGSGTTVASELIIEGGADKTLDKQKLLSAGDGSWTDAGRILLYNGASLTNMAAGYFQDLDAHAIYLVDGSAAAFENYGTYVKLANPHDVTAFAAPFNNHDGASIAVDIGDLSLQGGGTIAGTTDVGDLGEVDFAGGALHLADGATFTGDGFARVKGGTTFVDGSVTALNFAVDAGALDGTGDLAISGTFDWTGGTIQGTGSVTAYGTLTIEGAADKLLKGRQVVNEGTGAWSGDGRILGYDDGALVNDLSGSFTITSGSFFYQQSSDPANHPARFDNLGAVIEAAAAGTTSTVTARFDNSGSVVGHGGTLSLGGGGSSDGSFAADAGSEIDLSGGEKHLTGGTWDGSHKGFVRVTGGTTFIDGYVDAYNLAVDGGTVDGTGDLTVGGTLDWTGGTIQGGGVVDAAALTIEGAADKLLKGRQVANEGSGSWSGAGRILGYDDGALVNAKGGTFTITSGSFFYQQSSDPANHPARFDNLGAVIEAATAGATSTVTVRFDNSGATVAKSGTLSLSGGGSSSGSFAADAGSEIDLSGGAQHLTGGTWDGSHKGFVRVTGGTTFIDGSVQAHNLAVDAGAVDGTAALTVGGTLDWTGGTIQGGGKVDAAALTIEGAADKVLQGRQVANEGSGSWSGDGRILGYDDGVLVNGQGGTFSITTGSTFYQQSSDAVNHPARFVNQATVLEAAGQGVSTSVGVRFDNSGAAVAKSGTLSLSGGGSSSGSFAADAGAQIDLSGGEQDLTGGTWDKSHAGFVHVTGGSTFIKSNVQAYNLAVDGGIVDGTANLTVGGTLDWTGGAIQGSGEVGAAALTIEGDGDKSLKGRQVVNHGTGSWAGAGRILGYDDGVLVNGQGGTFSITTGSTFYQQSGDAVNHPARFVNQGTLTNATPAATSAIDVPIANSGSVSVTSGTLNAAGGYTQTSGTTTVKSGTTLGVTVLLDLQGGTPTGSGTIQGDVKNGGIVSPGSPIGVLTIQGNYTQTAAGALNLDIAGSTAGTGYDQLAVSGAVALDGTLNINRAPTFHPVKGSNFQVLTYGTKPHTGDFATVNGAAVTPSLSFQRVYDDTNGNLTLLVDGLGAPALDVGLPTGSQQTAGAPFDVIVTALDTNGAPNATYAKTVTLTSDDTAAAALGSYTFTTADAGTHTFHVALKTAGPRTLKAADGTLTTNTSVQLQAGAADHLSFAKQPADAVAGTTLVPVTVRVLDAFGNLTGSTTSIVIAPSTGTLHGTLTEPTSAGVATFADLSVNEVGQYTLSATTGSLTTDAPSSQFTISPAAADHLAFGAQPSDTAAGAVIGPVTLRVLDRFNNLVVGNSSLVSVVLGGVTGVTPGGTLQQPASGGVATFGDLSITKAASGYLLKATDGTLTAATSNTFAITPAAADHLTFTAQPGAATAGAALAPPVTVAVLDHFGNVRTGDSSTAVKLTLGGGAAGATLFGTATQTAAAGVATFTDLSVNAAATGYFLAAASGTLTGTDSAAFDVKAAAASQFGIVVASPLVAGTTNPVTVTALDPYRNTDGGYTGTVALTSDDPAAPSLGTFAFTAASGGQHTFQVVLKTAGARTLTAGDGRLTGPGGTTIIPAPADHLAFVQPPTDGTAGKTLAAVSVRVLDAFGNVVTSSTPVAVSLASSNPAGAVLSGPTPLNSSNGVATFSDLVIDRAGTDTLALKVVGQPATLTSAAFTVAPGTTLIARDDNYQVAIGDTLTLAAPGVLANDSPSVAGSPLSLVEWVQDQPLHGKLRLRGNATFTYTPQAGFTGIDTFSYVVEDGAGATGQATINITVGPRDKPPVLTVPAAQTIVQDTALVLNGVGGNRISVADPDAGSAPLKLTVSVAHGKLTLAGTTRLTFAAGGNNQASFTVTGAQPDLNAALNGLTYTPAAGYAGSDSLSLLADDQGNTGVYGPLTDSKTVALTVQHKNLPPVVTAPGGQTTQTGAAIVFGTGHGNAVSVADPDAGTAPEKLTLAVTHGTVALATTAHLTFTTGSNNTATFAVTGALTDLNAALNGLTYTPTAGYDGTDSLVVTDNDQGNTGVGGALSASKTVAITIQHTNLPPVLTVPGAQATGENVPLLLGTVTGNRVSVADPDAGTAPLQLTLGVGHGRLVLATTAHLTFTAGGNGSASFTVSGAQADLNAALDGLAFVPAADFSGTDSLSLFVNDLGHTGVGPAGTDSKSVALTVSAVNQAPVVAVPASQATAQDAPLVFGAAQGNAITVSDVDAGGARETATFTATHGELMLAGGSGLSFTTSSFTGTLANLNAAMNGLTFFPDPGYNGPAALDVVINDQGNSGSGGAKTGRGSVLVHVGSGGTPAGSVPAGVADSFSALAGVPLRLTAPSSLLDNDTFAAGSFGRTAVLASAAPGHGSFSFSSDGTFSYLPDAGFNGAVSFQYRPQDSVGLGALTTVTIQVGSQVNQAALTITPDGKVLTFAAPAGVALSGVRTGAAASAAPGTFPVGPIDLVANVGKPGAATTVTLTLPAGVTVNHYYVYGHVPGDAANSAAHWYAFDYDGHTGAEIHGNTIVLHYIDGQRGDNDLTANGVIVDPGAPSFVPAPKPAAVVPPARLVTPIAGFAGLTADEVDGFFGVGGSRRGRRRG